MRVHFNGLLDKRELKGNLLVLQIPTPVLNRKDL